jgi:hypothetical protein
MNRQDLEWAMDLHKGAAFAALWAMARVRPQDLTDYALSVVRDYDHAEALLELDEVEA